MQRLDDFIVKNNSRTELERFVKIVDIMKQKGVLLVFEKDRVNIMDGCQCWLRRNIRHLGIEKQKIQTCSIDGLWKKGPISKVVIIFANLYAKRPRFEIFRRIKRSPWVTIQTEHKGYRVYKVVKSYQLFLRSCDQVWDFGFDYCRGSRSLFLPSMFCDLTFRLPEQSRKMKRYDVIFLGKTDPKRQAFLSGLIKSKISHYYRNSVPIKQSVQLLTTGRIGVSIPRQPGNFEFHRFGLLAISSMAVLSLDLPPQHAKVQKLMSDVVEFFPNVTEMIKRIRKLKDDPEQCKCLQNRMDEWLSLQDISRLYLNVYNLVKNGKRADEWTDPLIDGNPEHKVEAIPVVKQQKKPKKTKQKVAIQQMLKNKNKKILKLLKLLGAR